MVRASLWLDKKRDTTAGLVPRDTTVTGRFVEDAGRGVARVQIPHDGPENVVNVPVTAGVYAPGAIVSVTLSTRGVPLGVTPPLVLPEEAEPVPVGAAGHWQVQATQEIQDALADALAAQTTADGANAILIGTGPGGPDTRSNSTALVPGDLNYQVNEAGTALVKVLIWNGTQWGPYRLVADSLLVAGSITAELLAAQIVLVSTLIAGNPAGTHVELTPTGLRVYAPAVDGGAPREVIRLGTDTDDYLGIVGPDEELAASIDTEGDASFAGLTTKADPVFAGRPLLGDFSGFDLPYQSQLDTANLGWLDRLPRGLVASGYGVPADDTISTRYGIAEVQFLDYPGRGYRVILNGLHVYGTAGAKVLISLRFTRDGSAPTINSPLFASSLLYLPGTGQAYTVPPIIVSGAFRAAGATSPSQIRILACIERQAGTGNIGYNTYNGDPAVYNPFRLTVDDIGLDNPDVFLASSGGGSKTAQNPTPPPTAAKVTRTDEWAASWAQNYNLAGATTTALAGKAVQGGTGTARKSLFGFPSVTATVSGSTINYVEVYLEFPHWYYNSGGTAVIGTHGAASRPTTYAATDGVVTSPGWPKPGGRWVRLPASTHAGWKSGAIRGISLRAPGDTTNLQYYGYALIARVRINHTK